MPKFTRNISPEDQAQIQEAGQNPAEYLLEEESGELMHQDDAPALGVAGNIGEALKGIGRGALAIPAAPFKLAGTTADAVRMLTKTYDPNNPSEFTKLAKGIESFGPEADPRAHWAVSGGGEALGNIGGTLFGGGLASKLGAKAIKEVALSLGASQIGADTAEQELARQLREKEEVSPLKVAGKAIGTASVGRLFEELGGLGKLLDDVKKPANTLGQISKRGGVNVLTGGATEAGQQGSQDLIVEGQLNPENLKRAFVLGGGAQGVTSAGLDTLTRDSSKPWFGQPEEEVDVESLKGKEKPVEESYKPSEETVAATLRRQEMDKRDRPKRMLSNPVDDITDKLIDSGVALDKDKLLKLYGVWNGKEENIEALQTEARRMQDEAHALGPAKLRTTLDVIGEEQTIRENYDKQIAKEESAVAKNTKILADPETLPGTRLRAQAELASAQKNLETLLTQRTTELGGIRPADPIDTRVANVPKMPNIDTGSPGVRTTVTREGRPAEFPNPARVTDVQTVERGNLLPAPQSPTPVPPNPQVTPEAIGPAIPMGTGQRASERSVLTPGVPEVDPAQEAARLQREKERQILSGEGEQGSPFGNTRYSGIDPKIVTAFFNKIFKHGAGPNLMYHMHKGTTSRMATLNPEGAYLKYKSDAGLTNERNRFTENLLILARPVEKFLNNPAALKWLNERSDKRDWDVSSLPKSLQGEALKYKKFIEDVADIINSHGVYVQEIDPATGKIEYRPHKKSPGYFPWMVGEQVFEASGDELAKIKKDFTDQWIKKFGKGADRAADVAFQNLLGISTKEGVGATPAFGPVRLPQGITLPESMRAKSPVEALNRYIRGVSRDLGWAVAMEQDPTARRILGVHRDPKGTDTFKTDPTTWDQVPEAWAYAVREGKRVRTRWARNADENKPPNTPINLFNESKLLADMQAGYRQAASPFPHLQATSNLASSILLELPSGTRDAMTSSVAAAVLTNPAQAVGSAIETIFNPLISFKAARRSGAVQGDMLAAEQIEAGKVIARSLMRTARAIRKGTGREALDTYGQLMIYNALTDYMKTPGGEALIEEFGPAFSKGMSIDEKRRITVSRLVERYSNKATPQNLTPGMLPHAGNPLSSALSLTRWSQAQWNNFSEDIINKWLNDKGDSVAFKRLLTWGLGSIIGGTAINKLWEEFNRRKPRSLTWGEWLNIFNRDDIDKDRKAKEFAYTAATQLQTIGTLGTVGDVIVMPAVKAMAGEKLKDITRNSTDLQYPAAIMGMDWLEKTRSYFTALSDGRSTPDDFWEYLGELAKTAQNVKIAQKLFENIGATEPEPRKGAREMAVYERVLGKDAQTGKPVLPGRGQSYLAPQDPFSFTRQMLRGEDPMEYRSFIKQYRDRGEKLDIKQWSLRRKYYEELEGIIGEEEARKRKEKDQEVDRAIREKNREIRRVR